MLFFFMFFFLVNSEASEPLRSLSLLNATHFICQANYFGQLEIILNDAHASAKLTVSETDVQEFINDSATTKDLFRVPGLFFFNKNNPLDRGLGIQIMLNFTGAGVLFKSDEIYDLFNCRASSKNLD